MENKIKFDKETFYLSNPDSKNQKNHIVISILGIKIKFKNIKEQ